MDCYRDFAYVYDLFMDQVPYEAWLDKYIKIFEEFQVPEGAIVLDMCCGTGTMTRLLSDKGYDMIGVDASEDMLEVARELSYVTAEDTAESDGCEENSLCWENSFCEENSLCEENSIYIYDTDLGGDSKGIIYICQDMREFELYGTVAAAVCACDSVNYITDDSELLHFLKLMNNYLDPGAPFIFDFNTPEKYGTIGDSTIAENREEASFIWENYYDEDTHINEYDLTLFVREDASDSSYSKYTETHVQRGYSKEEMHKLITQSGMIWDSFEDLEDGRVLAVCHEQGKI